MMTSSLAQSNETKPTLVLGATGATGKWVTKQLLDQGRPVKVVVRSKDRLLSTLQDIGCDDTSKLQITEASLLDLPDMEFEKQVAGSEAVVSCLGHNLNFQGLWGRKDRRLVTQTLKRVVKSIQTTQSDNDDDKTKFIVMGTDGVSNPNGQDSPRTLGERIVLFLLRWLLPPHADNEEAAAFLHSLGTTTTIEWSVVRPTDLIDGPPSGKYNLFDKTQGGLFGAGVATRSNVAHMMTELVVNDTKWQQYKFQMPVLHDIQPDAAQKSEL